MKPAFVAIVVEYLIKDFIFREFISVRIEANRYYYSCACRQNFFCSRLHV